MLSSIRVRVEGTLWRRGNNNNNNNNPTPLDYKTHTTKNGSYTPENMEEYKDPSYRENYPLCTNLNCVYYANLKDHRMSTQD